MPYALVIVNGEAREIADGGTLIVGAGIVANAASNISIEPAPGFQVGIGATSTGVNLGGPGITTTAGGDLDVVGNLDVTGNETIHGTTVLEGSDIQLGDAATDRVHMTGRFGKAGALDFVLSQDGNHAFYAAAGAVGSAGRQVAYRSGAGGDADALTPAGNAGTLVLGGSAGGQGHAAQPAGDGASVSIIGGPAGANLGGGAGVDGAVFVGASSTTEIVLGGAAVPVPITQAAGAGQVTFTGNVDAGAGLDVTGTLTVGGAGIDLVGDALRLVTGTGEAPQVPQLTQAQRNLLVATDGMILFNTTAMQIQGQVAGVWIDLGAAAPASPWQTTGNIVNLVTSTNQVFVGGTSVVGANGDVRLAVIGSGTSNGLLHLQQPVGYLSGQAVVRLVDSTGTKWLEILGHAAADNYGGHAAFGGISADNNSAVAAQLIGGSSTHARAFDGTTLRSGALGADGFAYGQWLRSRANGGSSSGTIAIGDGRPRTMFIGVVAEALQEGAGTHTGDMCGVLGFSGGDAAGALGAMNRVIGVAGAVGWTTDATGASAITTGAALIANSPQNSGITRTIGAAKGLQVENQGATGVANAYGIDIAAQSGAATANIGLRSQSPVVIGAAGPIGAEQLHVAGDTYVGGKLTVMGLIDPTAVILAAPAGADLYFESADGGGAAVAPVGRARQRYNGVSGTWQFSVSGGPWQDAATGARVPTRADKGLSPLGTVGNGAPTGVAIGATPTADGYVGVSVNGVAATVGDAVLTKECYFSADLGVTAKPIADIVVGNALYWNGVVAGFNLAPADIIDLNYDI